MNDRVIGSRMVNHLCFYCDKTYTTVESVYSSWDLPKCPHCDNEGTVYKKKVAEFKQILKEKGIEPSYIDLEKIGQEEVNHKIITTPEAVNQKITILPEAVNQKIKFCPDCYTLAEYKDVWYYCPRCGSYFA